MNPTESPHDVAVSFPGALGDSALQSHTLESVSSAVRYHAWLTSLALPFLGDDPLELGSGLGDYAQTWLDQGVARVTATEVADDVKAKRSGFELTQHYLQHHVVDVVAVSRQVTASRGTCRALRGGTASA